MLHDLNDNNYHQYLSDYDYDWLYPINDEFNVWLEDKLSFKYLLAPFSEFLPLYYLQIKQPRDIPAS